MQRVIGRTLLITGALAVGLVAGWAPDAQCEEPDVFSRTFAANDSLDPKVDDRGDAQACLKGLCWTPGAFDVVCEQPGRWQYDALVRFPSPSPSGVEAADRVAMEWHWARNEAGEVITAPGLIVVHESGRAMEVGRAIAYLLSRAGVHTFLIQLPGYGERTLPREKSMAEYFAFCRQGIADVRRARDAAAVLPMVDQRHIALQGTSLGGFIGAVSASLDGGFDSVYLILAGGDLYDVLQNGTQDAAKLRERLEAAGLTGDKLREGVDSFEPNRVAHRMNPETTWLFSGKHDTVVPLKNAESLAQAIGLDDEHHVILPANHYSGVLHLPKLMFQIRDEIQRLAVGGPEQP